MLARTENLEKARNNAGRNLALHDALASSATGSTQPSPGCTSCVLSGSGRAISIAIHNNKVTQRFTALVWRLRGHEEFPV